MELTSIAQESCKVMPNGDEALNKIERLCQHVNDTARAEQALRDAQQPMDERTRLQREKENTKAMLKARVARKNPEK